MALQGMVLVFLRRQALRVCDEFDRHPIALRIRSDPFYSHYLLPRFEDYYALQGWEFPSMGALHWLRRQRTVEEDGERVRDSGLRRRSRVRVTKKQDAFHGRFARVVNGHSGTVASGYPLILDGYGLVLVCPSPVSSASPIIIDRSRRPFLR